MSSIIDDKLVEQTYGLLISCMMQAKHRLIDLAGNYDITGMQAIMVLLLDQPCPMNSFTKVFNCDASNITGIVDGLENKGVANRFPDKHDRRIKMVKLSPKGEKLRDHFIKLLVEDKQSNLFKLSNQELRDLNNILDKITEA